MDKKDVGNRIRRHRESLSLTRDQFAEKIDLSPQFIAEIENGTKGMSAETLFKICRNVNASADYILFGRQSVGDIKSPAAEKLCMLPPQYTTIVEDILQSLLNAIEVAKNMN